jgi:hypothetical protein
MHRGDYGLSELQYHQSRTHVKVLLSCSLLLLELVARTHSISQRELGPTDAGRGKNPLVLDNYMKSVALVWSILKGSHSHSSAVVKRIAFSSGRLKQDA